MAWMIADRLFRMALGIVVLGWVARYLGTELFGDLNYAISLTALFASVASLGIEGIVIRELVKAPDRADSILGTAFLMRLGGGLAAILLIVLASLVTESRTSITLLIITVSLAFLPQSLDVIDLWFQKHIASKYTVLAKTTAVLVGAVVKITLVRMQAPLIYFAGALVLDAVLGGIALIYIFHLRGPGVRGWNVSLELARSILRDSWPLIFAGFLVATYMRIEQILVMNLLGRHNMGIYSASGKIAEMWNFIPTFILSTIYPLMVQKRESDEAGYQKKLQQVFDLLTGIGYGIAVGVTLVGPFLIPLVYGQRFQESIPILLIQAWSAPIIFNGAVRAQYFLLENVTIYHTWAALSGILVNISLALYLMPRLQGSGAALAALVGYFVSAYLTSLLFPRLRSCGWRQTKSFLMVFRVPSMLRELRTAYAARL